MEMLHNAINWFEIPVIDFDRARKFYSTIYDFEMPERQMGPNKMGFLLFDFEKQGIGGAIVCGEGYVPVNGGIKIYLNAGSDVNIILDRVENAGGKILVPKTAIGENLGFMAMIEDTEGNQLMLHSVK